MSTTAFTVADALGAERPAHDVEILGVSPLGDVQPHTLSFVNRWTDDAAQRVAASPDAVFLVEHAAPGDLANTIRVDNPRLAYARAVAALLVEPVEPGIAATAVVDPAASVDPTASIGELVVIEAGARIGARTVVDHHAVVKAGVTIGADCRIGSHTTIGGPGFGYERDETGAAYRIPHLGTVEIGDRVEIGNAVSIARGTIGATRLADGVKVDDCVFIAHNVQVEQDAFIIAAAAVSGSSTVGERAWVAPGAVLINKITVGPDAVVGLGAVVVRDVPDGAVVVGNPARPRSGGGSETAS